MTYPPSYTTPTDPTLPHQVHFYIPGDSSNVNVSCNCLASGVDGKIAHVSMGESNSIERSRELYNNPAKHARKFGPEDVAKW